MWFAVWWGVRVSSPLLPIAESQREVLQALAGSRIAAHREVARARALLLAAGGEAQIRIAREVGVSATTVRAWRERFATAGLKGLGGVRLGRGRKPQISDERVAEIVRATLVGLYLSAPEKAVVLCMDEKSQIQALDRTQASLPMKKGRAGTMTHDYKRNGTTTLFAALDVLSGQIIGQCLPRHRHEEFPKFLRTIDRQVPNGLQIHPILDNYATHKHPNVKPGQTKHPRFHQHLTPTSSSWLNLVERFFGKLDDKAIRRGIFKSVPDLIAAIETYLQANNQDPKPFTWTATADSILAKVRRGRVTLDAITN